MMTIYDKYFTGVCIRQHCKLEKAHIVSQHVTILLRQDWYFVLLSYYVYYHIKGFSIAHWSKHYERDLEMAWNSVTSMLMSEILGVLSPHPFTPHHQSHRAAWLQISQHLWLTVDLNQSQESCASYYTFVRVLSANSPVSTPRESIDSHAVLSVFTVTAA